MKKTHQISGIFESRKNISNLICYNKRTIGLEQTRQFEIRSSDESSKFDFQKQTELLVEYFLKSEHIY